MAWNFSFICTTASSGLPRSLFAAHSVCSSIRKSVTSRHWSIQRLLSTEPTSKNDRKSHPQSVSLYGTSNWHPQGKAFCLKLLSLTASTSVALYLGGITSMSLNNVFCSVGIVLAVELYLLSMLTTNHVSFMYAGPHMSQMQIAYVDNQGSGKMILFQHLTFYLCLSYTLTAIKNFKDILIHLRSVITNLTCLMVISQIWTDLQKYLEKWIYKM